MTCFIFILNHIYLVQCQVPYQTLWYDSRTNSNLLYTALVLILGISLRFFFLWGIFPCDLRRSWAWKIYSGGRLIGHFFNLESKILQKFIVVRTYQLSIYTHIAYYVTQLFVFYMSLLSCSDRNGFFLYWNAWTAYLGAPNCPKGKRKEFLNKAFLGKKSISGSNFGPEKTLGTKKIQKIEDDDVKNDDLKIKTHFSLYFQSL